MLSICQCHRAMMLIIIRIWFVFILYNFVCICHMSDKINKIKKYIYIYIIYFRLALYIKRIFSAGRFTNLKREDNNKRRLAYIKYTVLQRTSPDLTAMGRSLFATPDIRLLLLVFLCLPHLWISSAVSSSSRCGSRPR